MTNFAGSYTLDPTHTVIGFVARHAMVTKVRGKFNEWDAKIEIAENPADSNIEVVVKTASVDTGNEDRDGHVRADDFFNSESYPDMTFKATDINVDENGNGTLTGDLTIRETTKSVTLDVETEGVAEDPFGNTRVGFEASTKIDRTEFGLNFNAPLNTGGVLVSEKITIEIEGSAIKNA
ncbi:YceI family protein [Corynebacterium sp. L4756]|uniref:YceI family protein n=1 Tax=unclassified Corynebacterium TaxID=2624378 RepID=UPI00374C9607